MTLQMINKINSYKASPKGQMKNLDLDSHKEVDFEVEARIPHNSGTTEIVKVQYSPLLLLNSMILTKNINIKKTTDFPKILKGRDLFPICNFRNF